MAELSVKIIKAPNKSRKMTIGNNHHFLRTLKNCQNSLMMLNLLIYNPFYYLLRVNIIKIDSRKFVYQIHLFL